MPLTAGEALAAALAMRGGDGARIRAAPPEAWASATFAGARHRLEIRLPAARAAGFSAGLGDVEFALRGHIVADIAVAARRDEGDDAVLAIEALTIEDV